MMNVGGVMGATQVHRYETVFQGRPGMRRHLNGLDIEIGIADSHFARSPEGRRRMVLYPALAAGGRFQSVCLHCQIMWIDGFALEGAQRPQQCHRDGR